MSYVREEYMLFSAKRIISLYRFEESNYATTRTIIMKFTVRPKESAICSGGGGADPMVPTHPIQPMNKRTPVPTISATNIVIVFPCTFHIPPVKIVQANFDIYLNLC